MCARVQYVSYLLSDCTVCSQQQYTHKLTYSELMPLFLSTGLFFVIFKKKLSSTCFAHYGVPHSLSSADPFRLPLSWYGHSFLFSINTDLKHSPKAFRNLDERFEGSNMPVTRAAITDVWKGAGFAEFLWEEHYKNSLIIIITTFLFLLWPDAQMFVVFPFTPQFFIVPV